MGGSEGSAFPPQESSESLGPSGEAKKDPGPRSSDRGML